MTRYSIVFNPQRRRGSHALTAQRAAPVAGVHGRIAASHGPITRHIPQYAGAYGKWPPQPGRWLTVLAAQKPAIAAPMEGTACHLPLARDACLLAPNGTYVRSDAGPVSALPPA
jgi:hypothetical protein